MSGQKIPCVRGGKECCGLALRESEGAVGDVAFPPGVVRVKQAALARRNRMFTLRGSLRNKKLRGLVRLHEPRSRVFRAFLAAAIPAESFFPRAPVFAGERAHFRQLSSARPAAASRGVWEVAFDQQRQHRVDVSPP
jgi:hypothetical protein